MRNRFGVLCLLAFWSSTALSLVFNAKTREPSRLYTVSAKDETLIDGDDRPTTDAVRRIAVAGATGRTGSLVVQELLDRKVSVVAMVRSADKAKQIFRDADDHDASTSPKQNPLLTVLPCDLTNESQITQAVKECDAVIWCATGFSDAQTSLVERIKRLLGIALAPKQSIDSVGVPLVANAMLNQVVGRTQNANLPKVVMLSSAGVSRPSWDEAKKAKYRGCADIPIVRLNPFGILDVKAESEEKLRQSGVNYCIVRPTGLNDQWPAGSRPLFSQGDVAVGRINRKDVAKVLCDVLSTPEACDKTFEVLTVVGYPPARNMAPALSRLRTDAEGLTEGQIEANYALLQQLLPGEVQDAAQLAMGQTYEQLDQGTTGRLGPRGTEDAEAAAPKPTTGSILS